ncbi:MAG: hypothetical protein KTR25_12915 [Myxococcales bacterium]|nr:hypothetical protein [Myxococcales bacterium]
MRAGLDQQAVKLGCDLLPSKMVRLSRTSSLNCCQRKRCCLRKISVQPTPLIGHNAQYTQQRPLIDSVRINKWSRSEA